MSRLAGSLLCLAFALFALAAAPARQEKQAERIARLIAELGDDEQATRDNAEEHLKKLGEPALDALLKAVKHQDLEIRRRAARLLLPVCEAKAKRLVEDLGGKTMDVRFAAEKELKKLLDPKGEKYQREAARATLMAAMKGHQNDTIRREAEDVLTRFYAPHVEKLIKDLADDEFDVRAGAEKELMEFGTLAMKQLQAAMKHPDLEIRYRSQMLFEKIRRAR